MYQTVEIAHAKIPREELEAERHSVWPEDIMEGGSEIRINAEHVSRTQLLQCVVDFAERFTFFYEENGNGKKKIIIKIKAIIGIHIYWYCVFPRLF